VRHSQRRQRAGLVRRLGERRQARGHWFEPSTAHLSALQVRPAGGDTRRGAASAWTARASSRSSACGASRSQGEVAVHRSVLHGQDRDVWKVDNAGTIGARGCRQREQCGDSGDDRAAHASSVPEIDGQDPPRGDVIRVVGVERAPSSAAGSRGCV